MNRSFSRLDSRLHRSYSLLYSLRLWTRRHVTPTGDMLFWVMLAAGSLTDISQTMAHQVFGLLFAVLMGSLLWVRKPSGAWALERTLPRLASTGTPFTYTVRFRNLTSRWQRGAEFWEGTPDPRPSVEEFAALAEPREARRNWFDRRYRFYRWQWLCSRNCRVQVPPLPLADLAPSGSLEIPVEVTPLRRGRLTLHRSLMARTDPFGLFRRLADIRELPSSVLVFPKRFRLPPIALPGQSQRLNAGGVAMAGSVGDSEEFVSVREYRAGDPMRRIHWAGWARTQRPVVKEFQEEFFVRHALLLDTFAGGPEAEAFEDAVSLAASFASSVDERDSLLDLMFVGDRTYVFTGGRGLAHAEQLLEVLAGVGLHPRGDASALGDLVLRHVGRLSGCILIFLKWDEPRRDLRKRLESLGIPTLTFIVRGQPPPGDVALPSRVHWMRSGHVEADLQQIRGARNA